MNVTVSIQIAETESWHLPNEMLQMTGQDREMCGSYRLTKRAEKVICKVSIRRLNPEAEFWAWEKSTFLSQETRKYEWDGQGSWKLPEPSKGQQGT